MKEETEEERLQRLSNEEFARTGSCTFNLSIEINITEEDMLQDLVKRTEGKIIKVDKPNLN